MVSLVRYFFSADTLGELVCLSVAASLGNGNNLTQKVAPWNCATAGLVSLQHAYGAPSRDHPWRYRLGKMEEENLFKTQATFRRPVKTCPLLPYDSGIHHILCRFSILLQIIRRQRGIPDAPSKNLNPIPILA